MMIVVGMGIPYSMSENEIDRLLDSKMILLSPPSLTKSIIDSILSVSSLGDFIMRKVLKSVRTGEFPNDSGQLPRYAYDRLFYS